MFLWLASTRSSLNISTYPRPSVPSRHWSGLHLRLRECGFLEDSGSNHGYSFFHSYYFSLRSGLLSPDTPQKNVLSFKTIIHYSFFRFHQIPIHAPSALFTLPNQHCCSILGRRRAYLELGQANTNSLTSSYQLASLFLNL